MHKVLQTAQGLQAAALSAWRAELQRQRQACQQSNVLLMRALGHRLGASFAGWQAWAAEQHAAKARMQRAVGRLQALQRGAVLLQWRAVTAERRLLRGKAGKALRLTTSSLHPHHFSRTRECADLFGPGIGAVHRLQPIAEHVAVYAMSAFHAPPARLLHQETATVQPA